MLGLMEFLEGKLGKAESQLESKLFMTDDLRDELADVLEDVRKLLLGSSQESNAAVLRVRALYLLGCGYRLMQRREEGRLSHDQAISIGTPLLASNTSDPVLGHLLASCHEQMANLLRDDDKLDEAEPHYQYAIDYRRGAVECQPGSPGPLADLAESLTDQATYFRNRGVFADARKLYLEALELAEKLQVDHPQDPRYLRLRAATRNNLGWLELPKHTPLRPSKEQKDSAELARSDFLEAIRLYDRLEDLGGISLWIARERSKCYHNLCIAERQLDHVDAASRAAQAEVDGLRMVVKDHPLVPWCHAELAVAYDNLGSTYRKLGRRSEAGSAYDAAYDEINEACRLSPGIEKYEAVRKFINRNRSALPRQNRAVESEARRAGGEDMLARKGPSISAQVTR